MKYIRGDKIITKENVTQILNQLKNVYYIEKCNVESKSIKKSILYLEIQQIKKSILYYKNTIVEVIM